MTSISRVGVVGLGALGTRVARRAQSAGFPIRVFDRRAELLAEFVDGAQVVASPRDVATSSDVLSVCVGDDEQVLDVVTGFDGLLEGARPGAVICIHSTVHPATCDVLARVAARQGVELLDAPIIGDPGREESRFVAVVGGEPAIVERCRPILAAFADDVVHLGPVGAAMTGALLSAMSMAACRALEYDALRVAVALGLDEAAMRDMLGSVPAIGNDPFVQKDIGIARRIVGRHEPDDSQLSVAAARGVELLSAEHLSYIP